jgi:hypothetical protein
MGEFARFTGFRRAANTSNNINTWFRLGRILRRIGSPLNWAAEAKVCVCDFEYLGDRHVELPGEYIRIRTAFQ